MRPDSETLRYASDLIRVKARRLAQKAEFGDATRADIEQDLMVDILQRWRAFDPHRAKATTFIARVVEHGIASLIRSKRAAKRDVRRSVRLYDHDDTEGDYLDDVNARKRRGIGTRDSQEALALRSIAGRRLRACLRNCGSSARPHWRRRRAPRFHADRGGRAPPRTTTLRESERTSKTSRCVSICDEEAGTRAPRT